MNQIRHFSGGCLRDLLITKLEPTDAEALSRLLSAETGSYLKYFRAFQFSHAAIQAILGEAARDQYWGIHINSELAGMFMLRGLDEGYEVPSYGVYISSPYSGRGLSRLTLDFATSWSLLNDISKMMLSVHADNLPARRVYESSGFIKTGRKSRIGHDIYEKRLFK